MKRLIACFAFILATVVVLPSFVIGPAPGVKIKLSKKVNNIIKDKCYGCHNVEGRSEKAKKKLLWDELGSLDAATQMEKIEDIQKVLEKGEMPPKRMVEKDPSKGLTDKESAKLAKWASKQHKKIAKVTG